MTQNFFVHYLLFLAETATIAFAILLVVAGLLAIIYANNKAKNSVENGLEIIDLSQKYQDLENKLCSEILDKNSLKQKLKTAKKNRKNKPKHKLWVLDFCGDVRANGVAQLAEQINALKLAANPHDEVLLRLESSGGMMHAYGLAAAELGRLKDLGIKLTVAVDKVAASGGYMMACVADKIIAAPFAIVGSIGVFAQMPNFNRWLEKHDIDFEEHMAGEDKRTLSMFGKNTPEKRQKFEEYLENAHVLFKDFVAKNRQQIDIEQIATGKHWFAIEGLELKLIDEIITSQEYLLRANKNQHILQLNCAKKKSWAQKFQKMSQLTKTWLGF